ncbi:MAG: hypothetical protein HY264_01580 [Chloroflexi bacterium]|nr:hypothetical protein [Chloroflexota bacterium]
MDRRFWIAAIGGTIVALILLGVPSAVIPNPLFIRMTPTEPFNIAVWLASAPLVGLLLATYLAKGGAAATDIHAGVGAGRATLGGVAAYLAIGCPICNKIVVLALGVSGALNVFAPLQPLIGAASVALLAGTLAWRLRMRARGCARCAGETGDGPAPRLIRDPG